MAKTTRTPKTPRQRAEEALGVAQRKVIRLEREAGQIEKRFHDLEAELTIARRRRDYLKDHPDLDTPATTSTGDNTSA